MGENYQSPNWKLKAYAYAAVEGSVGSGWTSSCPSGMSLVGPPGTRDAFCMEINRRLGTYFHNAAETCEAAGKSLCTYQQWAKACMGQRSASRKPSPQITELNDGNIPEWVFAAQTWSGGAYHGGAIMGHLSNFSQKSCLNSTALDDDVEPVSATIRYRCCSY